MVEEKGTRRVPAFEWLKAQPLNVRKQLISILIAVRSTGPDNWHDPGTHRPMKGPIDHVHEARDKHGDTLYRLFVRWQREKRRVVLLDGRLKRVNTKLSDKEYEEIAALSNIADQDLPPLATADDFAQALLSEDQ